MRGLLQRALRRSSRRQVVQAWILLAVALFPIALMSGCSERLTGEDELRRAQIEKEFSGSYRFEFSPDIYIEAHKLRGTPTQEEADRIYRSFWMNADQSRRESLFTYLNLYDDRGAFKLQAYWDSEARAMSYSTTREHY